MTDARLACRVCRRSFDIMARRTRCECGGMLDVAWGEPPPAASLLAGFDRRRARPRGPDGSGVWRYRELVYPLARTDEIVSFPEGNTPLISRPAVAAWAGSERLELKHEGLNPTGSFKDRGMTVAVTHARRLGVRAVACASTGNTAASMAAYASQAGLAGVVLVPVGKIALGKLAQTVAYGARILAVRGDFDACLRLVDEGSERLGCYLVNSINPFRLQGQETIVLELLEQLEWNAPDWIVLPAGNLGNTAAFGAALAAARESGLIDRVPRLAAVQAAGAAPFAKSFAAGFAARHRVTPETLATAIRIGDPASFDRAVDAVRLTDGVVLAVSDDAILEAKRAIDGAGVGCEPASAASVAGVRQLVCDGVVGPHERVVAVLTGHVLKDPEILLSGREGAAFVEVDATLDSVARALDRPSGA